MSDMARKPTSGGGKKRKKKRKMKLTLKSRTLKKDAGYADRVGWSQAASPGLADNKPAAPEVLRHQCTMCGAMNQIPKPKRARYKIECANPDCGYVDEMGA